MDVYVERLYAALTDAMRSGRPRAFDAPVTVAEIYQDLVPYRVVRATLGFELNADYEHALLQLLAGAGGLARLEPEEAAAELRDELRSPNPNVGLFRKFAACDVWIARPVAAGREEEDFAPEPVEEDFAPEPVAEEPQERAPLPPAAPASATAAAEHAAARFEEPRASAPADVRAVEEGRRDAGGESAAGAAEAPAFTDAPPPRDTTRRCGFCDAKLPAGRLVRFCPQCGSDQARRPCVACGESLEAAWRFCVSCGAPQERSTSA